MQGLQKYSFGVLAVTASFFVLSVTSGCRKSTAPISNSNGGGVVVADSNTKRFLALGDSYTIGQSVAESDRFPNQAITALKQAGARLHYPAEIIARTGWTTLDLLTAITDANPQPLPPYDLVSLLIGVNNQYQARDTAEYRQQFTLLLSKAIFFTGNQPARLFVLSIPDYGYTPFGSGNTAYISNGIDQFNMINRQVCQQMGITNYIDITPVSRQGLADPSLVAGDGLHPSGKQYGQWVGLMSAKMLAVVK